MSEHEVMSWPEAFALLHSKPGVEISSLKWEHAGRFAFRAAARVELPDGTEVESTPVIWFSDHDGAVFPWRLRSESLGPHEHRKDWVVGRSKASTCRCHLIGEPTRRGDDQAMDHERS